MSNLFSIMVAALVLSLSVAATVPALANSAVGSKANGYNADSTYSAEAGAGGR